MTIPECIAAVDAVKANPFSEDQKADWLLGLDLRLLDSFYSGFCETPPDGPNSWPEDRNKPLRASGPWEDLYTHYLGAMVDYHLQELDTYNYGMSLYNELITNYQRSYQRTHQKKDPGGWKHIWS